MYQQRVLLIILILTGCGVLTAAPVNRNVHSSAVSRLSMTILPRVEVDTFPTQLAAADNETLCLSNNAGTDFSITVEGRGDIALDEISSSDGVCPDSSNIAFDLQIPDDGSDFGNQLTLVVSAE